MANILDYLDWRGDLTFAASPFNEVDNLILAQMSYADFGGIVTQDGPGVTIAKAAEAFFTTHTDEDVLKNPSFTKLSAFVLRSAGHSARFRDVVLSHYTERIDEANAEQFSALCAQLPDGTVFVAYRGTDGTLVGWKEDFDMSFLSPVPSQLAAVEYLTQAAQWFPQAPLGVCGHSKGGNLAVYAAVHAPEDVKARLRIVYNNDGPGFDAKTVQSEAYRALLQTIVTIVPESSIIGMLLEHEEEYTVVKSSNTGAMQHDAMSWLVRGATFETAPQLSGGARMLDESLHAWLQGMSQEQRAAFVDTLFAVLNATKAKTLNELAGSAWQNIGAVAQTLSTMSPEDRDRFVKTVGLLFTEGGHVLKRSLSDASKQMLPHEDSSTQAYPNPAAALLHTGK